MSRARNGAPGQPPRPPVSNRSSGHELDLFDLIGMIWSQRFMVLGIFLVLFIAGASGAILMLERSYEARARLLVLLDDEDPTPGAAGSGDGFIIEQVMQSESEILNSETVRRRALEQIGVVALLPQGGSEQLALRTLRENFSVVRAPNASVLIPAFELNDPQRAELALNAIVDAYLSYRVDVLTGDGASGVADRRAQADFAYSSAIAALDSFLIENEITDYEADRAAAVERVSTLQVALLNAQAERQAATAGASAMASRVTGMPETIELYVESNAENTLIELRLQRERLLSRYLETAPPVVAIDREIAELEQFIANGGVEGLGQTRTGVNEVRQSLMQEQLRLEGLAAAENRRAGALNAQLAEARNEVARLRSLSPQYQRLAQDVEANRLAAAALAGQLAEAQARQSLAPGSADAVRIVERAFAPPEGSSMKKIGVMAAFVLAAGIALLAGLLRGYWDQHLNGAAPAMSGPQFTPVADTQEAFGPLPSRVAGVPVLARIPNR